MTHLDKIESKFYNRESIGDKAEKWRSEGKKIVFTNGCFDLVHLGHIDYLSKAADLGDVLIVGLNSDASVSALKGEHRPLQNETSRMHIMAAFSFVDAVVVFGESTPLELINRIKPDVLVKGGDYTEETVVGAKEVKAYGGKVALIPFVEGYSTTAIERQIIEAQKS
ncbi:MAG: D-glycero-beta-D-manno-heptose 1-phosphate adenylyltransferase [Bacteroidetes bacterium]|nr:D-glycero-beta-D-manno-heptose 1-phosphate adenylyltransferase [Bacteroidota bacterium]